MPAARLTVLGVGDVRKRLERLVGAAKSDELVGAALKAGAQVYGDYIEDAMPVADADELSQRRKGERGKLKRSIKKGQRARPTENGPVYFSAVNRKPREGAPQGRWLHRGTSRQKARPEIFGNAVKAARSRARAAVIERLLRIQWDRV